MIALQLATALTLPLSAFAAITWSFSEQPKQCTAVTVNVDGGSPPYRILVIPFGPTPLTQEVRTIVDEPFTGNEKTHSLNLKYPANSQFVAVLSDASGFGSGGTTVVTTVATSSESSCFDPNTPSSGPFTFAIEPPNQIVQCTKTRIWWDQGKPQGDTIFLGVIPGGQSFTVPKAALTQIPGQGEGFDWTPSVRGGTTLLLVGGDSRGNGTAGSVPNTVSSGTTGNNGGCLSNDSPSSTPGTPAGAIATSTSTSSGGNPSSTTQPADTKGNNTGAIIGGVVAGIVALISAVLIGLFFYRRNKHSRVQKERPVDLLHSDEGDETAQQARLPQYYEPEPFIVPDPTVTSSDNGHATDGRTSLSSWNPRSNTPDGFSTTGTTPGTSMSGGPRKTPMRQLRAVNIIQHDDAGLPEEQDTIELPPAYTNLKPTTSRPGTPSGASATSGGSAGPSSWNPTANSASQRPAGAAGPTTP